MIAGPAGTTPMSPWMVMPGETWLGAAASFLAMWLAMMAAMMLPSVEPVLWRHRPASLTAFVAAGYLAAWGALGAAVFPFGAAVAAASMHSPLPGRGLPLAAGATVLVAAVLQLTPWKAHHLACVRRDATRPCVDARDAWRRGVHLGVHCMCSSAGATAVLLVAGIMDTRVMAAAMAAITAERLAPDRWGVSRAIGVLGVMGAVALIARAMRAG